MRRTPPCPPALPFEIKRKTAHPGLLPDAAPATAPLMLHTCGGSILDCAAGNAHGAYPGQLLVRLAPLRAALGIEAG